MKQQSIKINFIMNAILTMSSILFPLITFPYVSRVLLPTGTGKVSFAISMVAYFSMFAQLGVPTYGIRACAKVRDDRKKLSKTVHELFTINIIMSCFSYAAFFAALFVVPEMKEDTTLFLIIGSTVFFNAIGMEWLYKALEKYAYITIRSVIFKFVALGLMFAFVHTEDDYVIYGAITIFAAVGSNVYNFINARKYICRCSLRELQLRQHMKPVLAFFAMSVATTIYTNLDIVMLKFMKTDADVGYYNAAVRIKTILVSVVTSLGTVLLPRASYYIEQGLKEEFLRISKKALNFVLILAVPMMIYFILFAREGIFFLSGNAYASAIVPMQIIMPTVLFIGMSNILGLQMLIPMGKERQVLYSEIVGAGVDLILNIMLIPKYGAAGAAMGTVAAELAVWIYQYVVLRDLVKKNYKEMHLKTVSAGVILASAIALLVKWMALSNFLTLVLSAILFFAIYACVLLVLKEPLAIELFRQILERITKKK